MSLPDLRNPEEFARQQIAQLQSDSPEAFARRNVSGGLSPEEFAASKTASVVDTDNTFLSFLEPLQYGEFFTAGVVESFLKDKPLLETIKEKNTFSDIINEQFPELSRPTRIGLGFVASVVFDPLTYLTLGTTAATKVGVKGVLAGERALVRAVLPFTKKSAVLVKGKPVLKGIKTAIDFTGATRVGQKVKELFVPISKQLREKFPTFTTAKVEMNEELRLAFEQIMKNNKNILELVPDEVIRKQLSETFQITDDLAELFKQRLTGNPNVDALQLVDMVSAQNTRDLLERGLITQERIDGLLLKKGNENLKRRFLKMKKQKSPLSSLGSVFTESIGKAYRAVRYGGKGKNVFARPKSLEEARKTTGTLREFNRSLGKEFFEEDIAKVIGVDSIQIAEVTTQFDFLKKVSTDPAFTKQATQFTQTATGKKFFADLPDHTIINHPLFNGEITGQAIQVPSLIAQDLRGMVDKLTDPAASSEFIKAYDFIQNSWKAWTLGIFPAYHSRNIIGNVWQNYLADVNIARYKDAARIQTKNTKLARVKSVAETFGLKDKGITTDAGKFISDSTLLREARKHRAIDEGLFTVEAGFEEVEKMRRGKNVIFGENFPIAGSLLKGGRRFGITIENNAKLAHFLDRVKKGFSFEEAANSTKKFLFDYTELTNFERNIMKRIFPFYTWTRKNMPLQIEQLIQQPGKFANIPKIKEAIEESQGGKPNSVFMSDFLKEGFAIRTRKVGTQEEFFLLRNWLPATDILELLSPIDLTGQMISPVLKAPIQWRANYDFFFKRKIERVPGELGDFLGISMRKKIINALKNIRLLNVIDRLNPGNVFGTGRVFRTDLPGKTRLLTLATGLRLYGRDEQAALLWFNVKLRLDLRERKTALVKAQINNFQPEVDRLIKDIDELLKDGAAALATQRR